MPTSKITIHKKVLVTYKRKLKSNFNMLSQDGQVPLNSTDVRTPWYSTIVSATDFRKSDTGQAPLRASPDILSPPKSGRIMPLFVQYTPSGISCRHNGG